MFRIIVYSFKKKENSTKRVTPQLAQLNTEMECQILENGCGIVAPVITINYGLTEAPVNYNYAYIPVFKRYYFIKDWTTAENSLWQGVLIEDFLATWKTDIMDYNAYIIRAEHVFNKYVKDDLAHSRADITIISSNIDNPFNPNSPAWQGNEGGYYIVGIVGQQDLLGYSEGGVTYYVFDAMHMQLLNNVLMKDLKYMNIDWEGDAKKFITQDILQSMFNPMQYISSCMWFPIVAADKITPVTEIFFGYWKIENIQCGIIKPCVAYDTLVQNISIPKHPQSALGEWLNLSPYATYQAHIAPYGLIEVPADELYGSNEMAVEVVWDYITGNARIMLASKNRRFFNIVNFQLGVNVQVSQITQNPFGAIITNIAGGVALATDPPAIPAEPAQSSHSVLSALTTGNITRGVANAKQEISTTIHNVAKGIGEVTQAITSTMQSTGANGCKAWYNTGENFWRLSGKFVPIAEQNIDYAGRPLCEYHRIGDMDNGFLKCEGASLTFEGNKTEQEIVNSYLNSGFYKE